MEKKFVFGIVLVVLLTGLALFFSGATGYFVKSNASSELVVGYRSHVFYLPVMVAVENNLFEKHGLNVKPETFEKTSQMLMGVETGKVAASYGGINLLDFTLASRRGGHFKLISVTSIDKLHRTSCAVSKHFHNLTELSGKRIGYEETPLGITWSKGVLQRFNLDTSGMLPLKGELLLQSVEANRTDAAFVLEPNCVKAESIGYKVVFQEPLAFMYGDGFYLTGSVVSPSLTLGEQQKFAGVYDEAVEFIRVNPRESKEILIKYTKMESKLVDKLAIPNFLKSTEWTGEKFNATIEAFDKAGLLK
ncbi:MAG: ABC transporter substrate-binding protein [Candidatus Micrarchaeota archaeon]